jgi:hypothetical protein
MPASRAHAVKGFRSGTLQKLAMVEALLRMDLHSPGFALDCVGLEKQSQALQRCNLARNIQADGAPMVHGPRRAIFGDFFLAHRTPELCLRKPLPRLHT